MAMRMIWFILLGSLYAASAWFLYRTSPVLSWMVILLAFFHLFFRGVRPAWKHMRYTRKTKKAVAAFIQEHLPVLARKEHHFVKTDDYGIVHTEEWEHEKEYFIGTVLKGRFEDFSSRRFPLSADQIDKMIESRIAEFRKSGRTSGIIGAIYKYKGESWEDQGSYRQYCAGLLELAGWRVDPRGGSDVPVGPVIARKEEKVLVLTCVKASSPVGWGHVRRTAAEMKKNQSDMAALVTNAGFSRCARIVSSRYRVRLLDHDGLANMS